jgi:hypothetical protein
MFVVLGLRWSWLMFVVLGLRWSWLMFVVLGLRWSWLMFVVLGLRWSWLMFVVLGLRWSWLILVVLGLRWSWLMFVVLFMPFGLLALQDFKIVWHFNMQTMSIPHEGFSRGASCTYNWNEYLRSLLFLLNCLVFFLCNVYTSWNTVTVSISW